MLRDEDILTLNRLVADGLASGLPGIEAIKPFDAFLQSCGLTGEDLCFSERVGSKGLEGHVLLCDGTALSGPLERALVGLSGTGAHYNGMYGDGMMLRSEGSARALTRASRPASRIGEQVVFALRVLNAPQVSLTPDVLAAVQKHLSDLLLTYPVLVHPAVLVPVLRGGSREYVSVAGALATSPHGGLPRYSHFHPEVRTTPSFVGGREDEALHARLEAFARHPCVVKALISKAARAVASADGVTAKITEEHLVRSLILKAGLPRVEFLASIMELDELHSAATSGSYVRQPFWATARGNEAYMQQMYSVLAISVYAAGGSIHTAALTGQFPPEMRKSPVDLEFLALIKARAHLLLEAGSFKEHLESAMQRRVFLGRQDEAPAAELQHNVFAAVDAIQQIGLAATREEACGFVAECCVGRKKPAEQLPRTDVTGAVAFFQALEELGGLGNLHDQTVLEGLRDDILHRPARPIPFRDAWATACDVVAAERAMSSVIAKAIEPRNAAADESGPAPAWAEQVALDFGEAARQAPAAGATPARRRRMAM